ncbi:hypothetical protein BGZ63DRAFT_459152 [Mariannaea sp. PMI_226]|nr:hypothetical protein BGZ63DRAFT_459152 [Mariannaea sp. PMI_226]
MTHDTYLLLDGQLYLATNIGLAITLRLGDVAQGRGYLQSIKFKGGELNSPSLLLNCLAVSNVLGPACHGVDTGQLATALPRSRRSLIGKKRGMVLYPCFSIIGNPGSSCAVDHGRLLDSALTDEREEVL